MHTPITVTASEFQAVAVDERTYIAAEITDSARTMPTVKRILVRSIHKSQSAANKAATRLSASGRDMRAIPVSMVRPGSKRPRPGDTLATTAEASGLVAVADVD